MSNQPKLLDQVRNSLRQRNYSYSTEKIYLSWIKRFILYHDKRHPKDMGEKEGPEGIISHSTCPTCAEIARKEIEEYLEKEAEDAV